MDINIHYLQKIKSHVMTIVKVAFKSSVQTMEFDARTYLQWANQILEIKA